MGLANVGLLTVELKREKEKYDKKHDAAKYIKYLEEKNTLLLNEYAELVAECDDLKVKLKEYNEKSKIVLNEQHLRMLSHAVKHDDSINTLMIDKLSKEDVMYKVYFQELLEWGYLIHGAYFQNCVSYVLSDDKNLEVKKLLGSKGML